MGIDIMKRMKNKVKKFFGNDKPDEELWDRIGKAPVCGNCKYYQHIGNKGVVGICTHDKALHHTALSQLGADGKPIKKSWFLAIMPHFHCGMNSFLPK